MWFNTAGGAVTGVGVDIVEIARFAGWEHYTFDRLCKVFSPDEIAAFEQQPAAAKLSFLASRFAAKEAAYKALSNTFITLRRTKQPVSFEFARKHIEVVKGTWEVPGLKINWRAFEDALETALPIRRLQTHLSLAHERTMAIAMVVIFV